MQADEERASHCGAGILSDHATGTPAVGQAWRGCWGSQWGRERGACLDFILEQQGPETKATGERA